MIFLRGNTCALLPFHYIIFIASFDRHTLPSNKLCRLSLLLPQTDFLRRAGELGPLMSPQQSSKLVWAIGESVCVTVCVCDCCVTVCESVCGPYVSLASSACTVAAVCVTVCVTVCL